jgi:predicted nucleic acid-binding protein
VTAAQEPPTLVVDASVILKWQLEDEEHLAQALALRDDFTLHRTVLLVAPVLVAYEITNAIHNAARKLRLSQRTADSALANLLAYEVLLHAPAPARALAVARRLGVSGYDAAYVALAEALQSELWTADGRLFRATSKANGVRWIADYPVSS